MLQSIYCDDMVSLNERGTCFVVNIKFLSGEISEEDVIKIWFRYVPTNPIILGNQCARFEYALWYGCSDLTLEVKNNTTISAHAQFA